ncbi:ABC-type proline/glycine betaine transport system substrate-binding protein [Natranaerovirga hydrolytica]|uniref:ABC-type proline/glycine betaine transport system substrate-binding protein n=1 Tax=Natranaerovirga hydrolytica TaxID=680378 RepID=A0A4R1MLJ0_9FIRM|nr:glycine betaine ABC transporter substrate-binding protein [Natranaerovirga hydrolytica]TCK93487.1 ABC-type proline/glycine betaine transport system substrate-binding protein [Natranaerovirga hydrolytica]
MKKIITIVFILSLIVGCTSDHTKNQNEIIDNEKDVVIGYESYPSSMAQTYLLKTVLEDEGYTVGLKKTSSEEKYLKMQEGDVDIALGCWLPDIDAMALKSYEEDVKNLRVNYHSSKINLFAPKYSYISYIDDLDEYKEELEGTIYVLDHNEYVYELVNSWMENKGIEYHIISLSVDELDDVIENYTSEKKWFVFAGWSPHYLLGKYDLRDIEGEEFFYPQQNHSFVRKNYPNEDIIEIIKEFYLETWEMNELLTMLVSSNPDEYEMNVKGWIKNNPDFSNRVKK